MQGEAVVEPCAVTRERKWSRQNTVMTESMETNNDPLLEERQSSLVSLDGGVSHNGKAAASTADEFDDQSLLNSTWNLNSIVGLVLKWRKLIYAKLENVESSVQVKSKQINYESIHDFSSDANQHHEKVPQGSPHLRKLHVHHHRSRQCRHVPLAPSLIRFKRPLRVYRLHEVPLYLQDNEFIYTGYRAQYSYTENWKSLLAWHNETMNIWSHALGAFVAAALITWTWLSPLHPHADIYDHLIFTVFLLSALKCLTCSTLYHLHYSHSYDAYMRYGCLDFAGISALIAGSFSLTTYYGFYCYPVQRQIYLALNASSALVGILGPLFLPAWPRASFRVYRTLIYVGSCLICAFPSITWISREGLPASSVSSFLGLTLCYFVGAIIYAYRIPECFWPGQFDHLAHSHQFWHILVVVAVLFTYSANLALMQWRLDDEKGCL